tara:strand:+ start:2621 stop:2899 length:279 start_codon:yes stop_codon:yes gene_type:complete
MSTKVFDPTSEQLASAVESPDRLASLEGATIGLLDISKPRGDVFLDTLESLLSEVGAIPKRYIKPTFTKPAPVDLRHEIAAQCDAVIEALAD